RTQGLAERPWDVSGGIEAEGGLIAALQAGVPQAELRKTREAREKALRVRKQPITGVSEFPHVDEAPVAVLPADTAPPPAPQKAARTWPAPGDGAWFGAQIDALKAGASAEALGTPNAG